MTAKEELKEYLNSADPQDLVDCLKEQLEKDATDKKHFEMISILYWNEKNTFNTLSAGCKASILIYLAMRNRG